MEKTINQRLRDGEIISTGNKLLGLCRECGSIVQINKRIFGSMHFCTEQSKT